RGRPGTRRPRAGRGRASGGSGLWTWGLRNDPEGNAGARSTSSSSLGRERQRFLLAIITDRDGLAVADLAFEQLPAEGGLQLLLERALQRARPVGRLVADADEVLAGGVGQLQGDLAIREALPQPRQLDVDDLLQVLHAQRVEHDDLIDAVEEL